MSRIAVTTECVSDLPEELLRENDIDIIYFDIKTEGGIFRDTMEIHTLDILEYMEGGEHKAISLEPTPRDYKKFFERKLVDYDEVIHICISSKISIAVENSSLGRAQMGSMGQKVHIVDSKHLSAGQGFLALLAAKLAKEGKNVREILEAIDDMIPRIHTSFITHNADYLYYNGRASKQVMKICNIFLLHPVLHMKDGDLVLKGIRIGNYEKAASRYIRSELSADKSVSKKLGFLIHAGCNMDLLKHIEAKIEQYTSFERLIVNYCSATVSCNCGGGAFGVLFFDEGTNS